MTKGKATVVCLFVASLAAFALWVVDRDGIQTDSQSDGESSGQRTYTSPGGLGVADAGTGAGALPQPPNLTAQPSVPPGVVAGGSLSQPFPRGLGAVVQEALELRDPDRAYTISRYLQSCELADLHAELARSALHRSLGGPSRQNALLRVEWADSVQRECQSLQVDSKSARRELLKVASLGGIRGASAEYLAASVGDFAGSPEIIHRNLRNDADNGDVWSMAVLAWDYSSAYSLPDPQRAIYLNALAELAREGDSPMGKSAVAAFGSILRIAAANNRLPDGVSYSELSEGSGVQVRMRTFLVGPWAVTDVDGRARVQALVRTAKHDNG